jgi:putative ABC transport system substrate-binding protein
MAVIVCLVLIVSIFAIGRVGNAQQPKKPIKIGELVFRGSERSSLGEGRNLFRRALQDLGYIEGKNILFETLSAEGNVDRFPALAEELVHLKLDLLIASSMNEVTALKNSTDSIPIVMMSVGSDPVDTGLVKSLARPGGNITGVAAFGTETSGKRMELLKETIPGARRVAVLYDPANQGNLFQVKDILPAAARPLRLTIDPLEVRAAEDFEKVFARLRKHRPEAVFLPGGPLMNANQKRTAEFALKERLPSTFERREAVEIGGLMSYGPDRAELYRRAAYMVDKILKGTKPADLPVEQPTKFEFIINLKTAKQIGLTIPPHVLARADKVIK